ncbi:hypothetical protein OIDMADRAFT_182888 [Oidiodendron maius Zn]|uniref:Uncharacterized protein n=1 Tax=Oidiodendron maius (strain Zn) TaxID=913774 RepID=A0A0C3H2C1_OIDMZ|nr:hypothetical protein OIDMADRAFT_182888 [Oidiodendron maius Zn]
MQVAGQIAPRSLVGARLRPRRHILLTISPSTAASHPVDLESQCLHHMPNNKIAFREPTSGEVPAYTILSYTWGEEEVIYQDLKKGKDKSKTVNKAGWSILYSDQGKLAEAEAMYIRALEGYKNTLGPDYTSILDTVHNLEAIYLQALEGCEKALGPDHISTLSTVNNLGTLYKDQGKLAEAEAMYIRALEGKENALGPDYTSTLSTVNNLGTLYKDQGKLAEAEAMYIRALEGYENTLGPDHTSTLDTVHNLDVLYFNQGKLAEAEVIYDRTLQGYKDALGYKFVSSYIPALNTMFAFGDLFS